ncbi:Queuine tRNA-ribosyltransferase [Leuconostoc carnosum]|nr:hypothetical protein [Leuconostoc carnosum]SPJ43379.1 Queuine tRNA-ribosyltransferase [Leuconostoc carnosum]SPO33645.1 Queuine tRNA-ribosyltransferase [Leuconostoc carnosum]
MIIATNFLIALYTLLMSIAVIASLKMLPFWLVCINIISITVLGASLFWPILICIALVMLVLNAGINGKVLHGKLTFSHLIIRILFSLLIFALFLISK